VVSPAGSRRHPLANGCFEKFRLQTRILEHSERPFFTRVGPLDLMRVPIVHKSVGMHPVVQLAVCVGTIHTYLFNPLFASFCHVFY
jgi:hypothetical protein